VTEADALRANARELQAAHDAAVAARDEVIAQAQAAAEAAEALRSEHQAAVAAANVNGRRRRSPSRTRPPLAPRPMAAETAIEVHRAAERARLVGMLTAHRALIVDAMGRMVRRETEKARRHQATPAKLRAWAELFYATHAEICVEALRPAIRVHLAWKQSADDVETVTSSFVQDHIAESVRQLHAAIDGHDGEELSAVLDRMLTRWEQHRPEAFADRILREEVEHVTRH
jgi:hypothetical protein